MKLLFISEPIKIIDRLWDWFDFMYQCASYVNVILYFFHNCLLKTLVFHLDIRKRILRIWVSVTHLLPMSACVRFKRSRKDSHSCLFGFCLNSFYQHRSFPSDLLMHRFKCCTSVSIKRLSCHLSCSLVRFIFTVRSVIFVSNLVDWKMEMI